MGLMIFNYFLEDFLHHKKSRECHTGRQRKQGHSAILEKSDNRNRRIDDMSNIVQANLFANSLKNNLQLETDEAAVISLLANQLSQQQTQLSGPVLQDEGNYF